MDGKHKDTKTGVTL